MIEVEITYSRKTKKNGNELFIYKDVLIKGHSSDGTLNSIKCCAGVTAITCGLLNLFDKTRCGVEVNKGYFHYTMYSYDKEINYAINALVYQIDGISMTYPSYFNVQFKEIEFNEEEWTTK